jgi:flagellar motility protein MotE (MotC chaperone)
MPRKLDPEKPPRGFRFPFLLIAAAGLVGVLPWFGADLVHRWQAAVPSASPPPAAPPAPPAPPPAPAAGASTVVLPSGMIAQPVSVATLASTGHPSPIGDDRGVDGRILAEVARHKAELDQREKDLQGREAQLAAAEKLARQQIGELTQLRQNIEALIRHESVASDEDMNLLVGLFSNMKPAQAAAVIGKLDPPKAALILQRLETRLAGPIVAAMDPAAALAITEEVEQRRAAFQH